jgi:predicted ester cyclase
MTDGTGLIKRFYEDVIGTGQIDLIDELAAEGITDHEEGLPGQPSGREGIKFFVNAMRQAFPDIRAKTISPMLTDGDLEAAHVVLTGTHQGELLGVAATNKTVEFESLDIIRVEDGKVIEHWGVTDTMGLMQQIGAIPE